MEQQLSLYRFSIPFIDPISFKGQQLTHREGLWLVKQQGNDVYFGEASPLPGFSNESIEQTQQQLTELLQSEDKIQPTSELLPSVNWAIFCLNKQLPYQAITSPIANNIPLLLCRPETAIYNYQALGYCKQVKVKVGRGEIDQEIAMLQQLVTANPQIRLRLDANQQWSNAQYHYFLQQFDTQSIDYIEEPTACLQDSLDISNNFAVSIALDESLLTLTAPFTDPAIAALIIKPTLLGDPQKIQALLRHAKQHNLQVSISSSYESIFALRQLAFFAKQWQQEYAIPISQGLDTESAFSPCSRASTSSLSEQFKLQLNKAERIWPRQ